MRRLASPSALFGMWTLLFLLPAAPILIRSFTEPHLAHYQSHPALAPMKSLTALYALMPLLRFAPLSYPFFAVAFAAWPRLWGRSLDSLLGRWQFALSTVPGVLCVFVGAAIIGWNRTPGQLNATVPPRLPIVFVSTVYIVSAFWIASVALFFFNVARTLRDGSGASPIP